MSLLDWNKVQRTSLSDKQNGMGPIVGRPSAMNRPIHRRRSVEGSGIPSMGVKYPPSSQFQRHSLQVEDFMVRPSEPEIQGSTRSEYEIVWNNTFLGIVFRCNSKNQAVIRRIEAHAAPEVVERSQIGDVLVAFNGEPSISYDKTMENLRSPAFPAILTFAPPRAIQQIGFDRGSFHSSSTPDGNNVRGQPSAPSLVSTDMNESIVSHDDPENHHHTTFDVVWQEGLKLGVSIIKVGNIPVVKGRTCDSPDPSLSRIQANDQLISIQGYSTANLGYQASIVLLRDTKKPVNLTFRRKTILTHVPAPPSPVSSREAEYSLVWESGPLGITLKKDKNLNVMLVARLNGDGLAARCNLISLNDRLISVSDVLVKDLGLRGTMEFLKAVPKPATLVFQRSFFDPEREPSSLSCTSETSSVSAIQTNEDAPSELPQVTAALEIEDDHVAPLTSKQPRETPAPLPRSNTSSSTFSDLDDSGLYCTTLHNGPSSKISIAGPPVIEVTWTNGPLGMTLKQSGTSVVVSRITGKGEAPGLEDLQPGDILMGVNDMDTSSLDLEVATTLLKSLQKPIRLRFMLQKTEEDL